MCKFLKKNCSAAQNCKTYKEEGNLIKEIKKSILKKAAIYKKEKIKKNPKPYTGKSLENKGSTIF